MITRRGLPTSNRILSKPYVKELKPRAVRLGSELSGHFGIKREDRDGRDADFAANYDFFGAPMNYRLLCGIAIGYPSTSSANAFKANRMAPYEITIDKKK